MAALNNTRQNVVILAGLLFLQLLLMSGSVKGADGSTTLESWLIRLSSPVASAARFVGGGVQGIGARIGNLFHAHARNAVLEEELTRLRAELRRSREEAAENERLRSLLGMREDAPGISVAATVVTSVHTEQTKLIVVDRGTDSGVQVDHPVVAWGGAVGRVVAVSPGHAKVRLLTDPNSGVGALVQRSRVQGMVVGRPEGRLDLLYVPTFSDVAHGDRVVTSGMDGIFPRGFGIGEVKGIETSADGTQTIRLRPELDYRTLEEVMVLLAPMGETPLGPVSEEEPS